MQQGEENNLITFFDKIIKNLIADRTILDTIFNNWGSVYKIDVTVQN